MDSMHEMKVAGPAMAVPDPAVEAKPQRRRFTAEYKLRMLREVERAKEPGAIGVILRREGLYSSHLVTWRRERDRVAKAGLAARKRGPKATPGEKKEGRGEKKEGRESFLIEQPEEIMTGPMSRTRRLVFDPDGCKGSNYRGRESLPAFFISPRMGNKGVVS